jgi:two-component system, OmpR family, sensor histidine kinase KdpD
MPTTMTMSKRAAARIPLALEYTLALALVAVVSMVAFLFEPYFAQTDQVMLYLLGMIAVAFRASRGPALLTSVVSVAVFAYLFIDPRRSFAINDTRYLLTFAVMATIGVVVVSLVAEVRKQERAALEGEIAVQGERLRSALLASVSHDLRTPLGAILGAVTTLEHDRQLESSVQTSLLASIHDQAEHLNRLLRNLLEMTRLEGGAVALKRELAAIEEPVGTVLASLAHRIGERRIEVELDAVDGPLFALFDPIAVELVLSNLTENALRYGGDPIEIRATREQEMITVRVLDRGPGLDEHTLAHAFEKFQRGLVGQRKGGPGSGGAGLGLAIVRSLVEAGGGRVWARNREDGRGAEFGFTLPRAELPTLPEDSA